MCCWWFVRSFGAAFKKRVSFLHISISIVFHYWAVWFTLSICFTAVAWKGVCLKKTVNKGLFCVYMLSLYLLFGSHHKLCYRIVFFSLRAPTSRHHLPRMLLLGRFKLGRYDERCLCSVYVCLCIEYLAGPKILFRLACKCMRKNLLPWSMYSLWLADVYALQALCCVVRWAGWHTPKNLPMIDWAIKTELLTTLRGQTKTR